MKRILFNALIAVGTTLLIVAIFIGGWVLFDRFFSTVHLPSGTRAEYQETSRTTAMEQPVVYLGAEECGQCHVSTEQEWLHSSHSTVACESCHGAGGAHAGNGATTPVNTSADLCLSCHAQLASRPDSFPQVSPGEHSGGLPCLGCHNPMHPDIGVTPLIPHALYGESTCLACHDTQGLRPVPADHDQRSADSCLQCHAEGGQ